MSNTLCPIRKAPEKLSCRPTAEEGAGAPVRTNKYQILPHARVGGIAGLIELLHDRGGREDLFRLSEELVMDVEDLLPILEACVLLGFAWSKEGDVQLSPQGGFRRCRHSRRKVLFREAALEHVTILKQIDSILKRKSTIPLLTNFFTTFSTSISPKKKYSASWIPP
jgi:NitT/TauT family transport system ATP-binding protein